MGGLRCPYAQQWVGYYEAYPWFRRFASLYCDVIDTTNIENFSRTLSHRITANLLWGDPSCEREYFPSDAVAQGHFTYDLGQIEAQEDDEALPAEIWRHFQLSDEEFQALDETEFRARFRERLHHTLEIQTYASAYRKLRLPENQTKTIRHLMELWRLRGLSSELHEYRLAEQLVAFATALSAGEEVDLSCFAPQAVSEVERDAFMRIVRERRSVREFTAERVPEATIECILEAGLWAAHSCNLQSIRYLVVREAETPGLFVGSDIPGGPVHLVVCQDTRVYRANPLNPVRNQLLDAGAAAQNIVLAAHAQGLAGVWLTFNEPMLRRIREHYQLPEYIAIVTYVDVGFGDQTPAPVLRPDLKDVLL